MKLDGKVALVTGTSPNIGGAIAEAFAEEGAAVVCVDIHPDNAMQCAAYINSQGGRAAGVVCDVTDAAQVQAAVARANDEFGGLDVLVNDAVVFNMKGIVDMPLDEWRRQLDVILTGAFLCTKHAVALMLEQGRGGSIINISSTAGHQGQPGNVGYSTGKAGILNFTRSVAAELGPHGIRVNSITPTGTDPTEAYERALRWGRPAESLQRRGPVDAVRTLMPLLKQPRASHYGRAAVFLASDDAEMITGEDLKVDAGSLARHWTWGLSWPTPPSGSTRGDPR